MWKVHLAIDTTGKMIQQSAEMMRESAAIRECSSVFVQEKKKENDRLERNAYKSALFYSVDEVHDPKCR